MKKTGIITAALALTMGIGAPLAGVSNVKASTTKSAKTYSYVTVTKNTVNVTNMKKGTQVQLLNNKKQVILTQKVKKNGTLTFKLSAAQVKKMTATDTVKINGSYGYSIGFNYGYATTTKSKQTTTPKTTSYVSNTKNTVSLTNVKKGTVVSLNNNKQQKIVTQTAKKNGTLTFKLTAKQLKQVTAKDTLAVQLTSGHKYTIDFNFVGYVAPTTNKTSTKTTSTKTATKSTKTYSSVNNTKNSVSLTNVKKGTVVSLSNNKQQKIATQTAKKNGTLTFKLTAKQLKKVTAKDTLAVRLTSGYQYKINFNFVG